MVKTSLQIKSEFLLLSFTASIPCPIRSPTGRFSFLAACLLASYEAPLVTSANKKKQSSQIDIIMKTNRFLLPLTFSETA